MKRLKTFIRETKCKCPKGWSLLGSTNAYCLCIQNEPEGVDLDNKGSDLEEQMISAQDLSRPILFPLLDNDDTVKVKLSQDGMFIRVGSSGFFPVPEKEQEHLWR